MELLCCFIVSRSFISQEERRVHPADRITVVSTIDEQSCVFRHSSKIVSNLCSYQSILTKKDIKRSFQSASAQYGVGQNPNADSTMTTRDRCGRIVDAGTWMLIDQGSSAFIDSDRFDLHYCKDPHLCRGRLRDDDHSDSSRLLETLQP